MNRRVCVCIGLLVWSGLVAVQASGQTTTGSASIPANVKSAPSASSFRPVVQQFIQTEMTALTSEDAALQKTAREKLMNECTPGSSSSYFDLYAQELNTAASALLARKPLLPLRVRFNLAVAVETVARVGQNVDLEPSVIALINDPADAVALWGMKAAKPMIAVTLQSPALLTTDKLLPAILPAVKAHAKSGFLASDAYHALIPEVPGFNQTQLQALLPPVFTPILDVLDFRVSQYKNGIPDNPEAETVVARFFSAANFTVAKPAEQHRIIQELVNLISNAGDQATSANKVELEQIILALKYAAQELIVISGNSSVSSALIPLTQMGPGTPGAQLQQKTKGVFGIMQTTFQFLQPPPTVTPATAPAVAK